MPASQSWHRFVALTALVCLLLAGCGKKTEGDTKPADSTGGPPAGPTPPGAVPPNTPAPPVDLTKATPEATYTAKDYLKMSTDGSGGLIKKHPGKVVDMTGVVVRYGPGTLILSTGPNKISDTAAVDLADSRPWLKVLPKQTVKLRSAIPTSDFDRTPWRWQIVEVGSPPAAITAEEFVKEWTANKEAFKKKYGDDSVVVTGTVAEAKVNAEGAADVYLAAGKDAKLHCRFAPASAARAPLSESQKAALKPGQKVKILGDFNGDGLALCILLEPAP